MSAAAAPIRAEEWSEGEGFMRVRPTPALGVVIGILYIVSFIGLALAQGGVITDLTSVEKIKPFLVALGVSAAWLVVVTSVFGWWRPVLRDRTRVGGTRAR